MFSSPYPLPGVDSRLGLETAVPQSAANTSPLRREHVPQPPALTTTLNATALNGYPSAPNSTVSLSSPFSQNNPAYQGLSPGGAARGISPMSSRFSSGYSAPYNPQEWAHSNVISPHGGVSQQTGQLRPVQVPQGGDPDGVAAPPPPYSPAQQNTGPRAGLSPAESSSHHSSHNSTPTSGLPHSPHVPSASQFARPRHPSAAVRTNDLTSTFPLPPPPPPLTKSHSRPSSRLANILTGSQTRRNAAFSPSQGVSAALTPAVQGSTLSHYPTEPPPAPANILPPSARRAASTGVISISSSSSRATSHTDSRSHSRDRSWESGRPLPGPPPGPPPSSSRSQSVSGVGDVAARNLLAPAPRPKARQVPALGTVLGPVPPTPAGWVDDGSAAELTGGLTVLHVDTAGLTGKYISRTESLPESAGDVSTAQSQGTTDTSLHRSSAFRDTSVKGLRERRSASRSNRTSIADLSALSINSNNPWLGSVKSSPQTLSDPSRAQTESAATTPEALLSPDKFVDSSPDEKRTPTGSSQHSTPRAADSASFKVPPVYISQTPPWSAGAEPASPTMQSYPNAFVPTKALPTPPLGQVRKLSRSITRPISHILHSPNDETTIPSLSPVLGRRTRAFSNKDSVDIDSTDGEAFMAESLQRHEEFLRKEKSAFDDGERLQLFADYILAESCIRRKKYSSAWASGSLDINSVREGLFKSDPRVQRRASGVLRLVTPSQDAADSSVTPGRESQPEHGRAGTYHPALSPIASMSNDELSSRGRAPSRWWESQPDSGSDGAKRVLELSKRESKYMGLPREAREAMQFASHEVTPKYASDEYSQTTPDYPPEKQDPATFGYFDDDRPSPALHMQKLPDTPRRLDISRFITLPPPYPRHHPAVNNSHPDLKEYRTAVRTMSDLDDVAARKARYRLGIDALRKDHKRKLSENRRHFKSNIHAQVEEGSLSYAEAAEAEQALQLEEQEAEKKSVKAEFDSFQDVVLNPLHDMLNRRVSQADALITDLQHRLHTDAQALNPDQTQEAGDEEPELLEKLTQLKWLFETREQIHREIFTLLTERNETYKEVVLLPYRQAKNRDKLASTEAFFVQDNKNRLATFENDAMARYESFRQVVEDNVTRGVELQSSAFWDIAPGLEDLLQKIPEQLADFEGIRIPEQEFEENETYRQFPLQYLYSLLLHAERSTYQFIEAQVNLHCLLHEVKNGMLMARCRVLESGGKLHESNQLKTVEEANLTKDLQQKVSMVENIWAEALGSRLQGTKERVRNHLILEGGWDDMEEAEE